MIQIENTEVFGWEAAVRGARNPLNSWERSDSEFDYDMIATGYIGDNDLDLMKRLVKAGSDHSKFMRMIHVQCDVVAPLYWWKEYDTYKVGTVANSCSTMHKIHSKEFTLDDFSTDHLTGANKLLLCVFVDSLEILRKRYLNWDKLDDNTKNALGYHDRKDVWWQMIQLLPSSYNQRRTIDLNYAVLRNMYHARKNHKLDEWHTFCEWIEGLPYSELITM